MTETEECFSLCVLISGEQHLILSTLKGGFFFFPGASLFMFDSEAGVSFMVFLFVCLIVSF